jgi:penicillin-binding protein 2
MRIRRRSRYQAIEPDEILIDAANLPAYDTSRLEGRIERPFGRKVFQNFLLVALAIGSIFALQLAKLQVVDVSSLAARAEANHLTETLLIAERGLITDRFGTPLALNNHEPGEEFSRRAYPLGEATAHLIGYVSYPKRDDNGFWFQTTTEGLAGIELSFNELLRGENGAEIRETAATGEMVSGSVVRTPENGQALALSVDAGLQRALFEALKERALGGPFQGGSGVIMDVDSGEVLALASYPSFDSELLARGSDDAVIRALVSDPHSPFLDRALSGLYTPGSVVKPFIALAALEEGIISPEKHILSTGSITIPNPYDPSRPSIFRDWKAHGWVDMRQALAVSSDVYFYAIGGGFEDQRGLGISAIESHLRRFGIGEGSGLRLSGEAIGIIPNPEWKARNFDGERWFLGNTYHTAIGQFGFQIPPIELVRATAALASGTLVTPVLLDGAHGAREPLGLDAEDLRVVHEGMRRAVLEGTAAALSVYGLSVAGKTGTAEVGVRKEYIHSLVIGFFPYEHPRYAFALVMERGKAGTTVGAPAAMRNVLEWIVRERPEMVE